MNEQKRITSEEAITNSDELEFALFCIENIAAKLGVAAQRVYQALAEESNILRTYIIPGYDALHTQGKDYIVEDLLGVLDEKGVKI